jgi:DNA-binding transcriptional MerR regulator
MRIGEVAKKAGASVRSIRHYEQAGLVRASRGSNGYRDFGTDAVLTVRRIARMIRLGFGTAEIAIASSTIPLRSRPAKASPPPIAKSSPKSNG